MMSDSTVTSSTQPVVQCVNCKNFSFRGSGEMSRIGFGKCLNGGAKWEFYGSTAPRLCRRFDLADDSLIESRLRWRQAKLDELSQMVRTEDRLGAENDAGAQS